MQVPKTIGYAIILMALLPATIRAQEFTKSEKDRAIQTIASLIANNYVYPEKGGQIASHIQVAHHQGDFDKAADWAAFNELVTQSLRKFSNDEHLYLKKDRDIANKLRLQETGAQANMNFIDEDVVANNYGIAGSEILDRNIGYLKLSSIHFTEKSLPLLYESMRKLENTRALIIDLRDNSGGSSPVGPVLESYFLPEKEPLLSFFNRKGYMSTDSTVSWLTEKKYKQPVYILINHKTASAAEAFAFIMQQQKRARIVGEKSAGGAHMNEWFVVNEDSYLSVSTAAPRLAGTELTWEEEGVQPDIRVKKGDPLAVAISKIK